MSKPVEIYMAAVFF